MRSPLWNADVLRLFLQTRLYSEVQPLLHLVLSRMVRSPPPPDA